VEVEREKMPKRIQRKRTKGWKMPENTVYVGRPTKWGNPYLVNEGGFTRQAATELFRKFIDRCGGYTGLDPIREELRGKDLACWCPLDQPCHADVLLEIANQEPHA
jgi:hypothetical protein